LLTDYSPVLRDGFMCNKINVAKINVLFYIIAGVVSYAIK